MLSASSEAWEAALSARSSRSEPAIPGPAAAWPRQVAKEPSGVAEVMRNTTGQYAEALQSLRLLQTGAMR